MPSIAYETELKVDQPWLIESKSLEDLDAVIDACVVKMRDQLPHEIDLETERYLRKYYADSSEAQKAGAAERHRHEISTSPPYSVEIRHLTVFLPGGRAAEGKNFEDLMPLPNVQTEVPRGFHLRAQLGKTSVDIKLDIDRLRVSVSPEKSELSLDLFGRLENWVTEIQPSKWQQKWLAWKALVGLLLILWLGYSTLFMVTFSLSGTGQERLKQEARELIVKGVDPSNQTRAIQLILSLESDYEPSHSRRGMPQNPKLWSYLSLVTMILVGLCFPPTGAIGIWGGRRVLKRQRIWLRIVSVSIPLLVFTRVAFPWLMRKLGWI